MKKTVYLCKCESMCLRVCTYTHVRVYPEWEGEKGGRRKRAKGDGGREKGDRRRLDQRMKGDRKKDGDKGGEV